PQRGHVPRRQSSARRYTRHGATYASRAGRKLPRARNATRSGRSPDSDSTIPVPIRPAPGSSADGVIAPPSHASAKRRSAGRASGTFSPSLSMRSASTSSRSSALTSGGDDASTGSPRSQHRRALVSSTSLTDGGGDHPAQTSISSV